MFRYSLPLLLFAGLVVLFIFGLQNDPRKVASPFIDKPEPAFQLGTLHDENKIISIEDIKR